MDGDVEVMIKRTVTPTGTAIEGYRVYQLHGIEWLELTRVDRNDWFSRIPPAVSAAVLAVEESTPGSVGWIAGFYESYHAAERHEAMKETLRKAIAEWEQV